LVSVCGFKLVLGVPFRRQKTGLGLAVTPKFLPRWNFRKQGARALPDCALAFAFGSEYASVSAFASASD
jgi:hypothetical protein